jgi:hypothetical protein
VCEFVERIELSTEELILHQIFPSKLNDFAVDNIQEI